jgi:hypothetical protein
MSSLNLSQNGPSITASYQKVVNASPSGPASSSPTFGIWALYSVKAPLANAFQADAGRESVLSVQTTGEGELADLIDEFSDGRIQFAFVKVKDPNTTLPKSALIAWCGEGVPERTKGYFTSHLNAVAKVLHGYHVQVTARSDRDLTPEVIVQKVADASGAKYGGGGSVAAAPAPPPVASKPILPTKSFGASGSFQSLPSRTRAAPAPSSATDEDGWGADAPPVTRSQLEKVAPAYQPTKVNIAQLQSQREPSRYQPPARPESSSADVVSRGWQPIGKVDIAAIRREAQSSGTVQDDRPTVVKGAYEPIGKVDIAEIRRKAQAAPPPSQAPAPQQSTGDANDRPKSLADRSAAFTQAERITELPKPKIANKFGTNTSSFTGSKAPTSFGAQAGATSTVPPVATASRTFADEGGKTPAQVWAEKKARERGLSGAGDNPPSSLGASTPAVSSQRSGGWQSGYEGKKWDVGMPSRSGGSAVAEQRTGQQEDEESESRDIGSIRDRFNEPPALDTASKPSAGARGVPMPGLPQRSAESDVPAVQHQDIPPPPARPLPQDEVEEEDEVQDPYPQGSPTRIAMPVGRGAEPIEPAPAPAPATVPASLHAAIDDRQGLESEPRVQEHDASRAAAQTTAASSFGAAADVRGAGSDGGRTAIAQYDYTKDEANEIDMQEGERITGIEMVDDDWWMGENSKGERGLFPSNYVELVAEDDEASNAGGASRGVPAPPPAPPAEVETAPPAGPPQPSGGGLPSATAEYDYEATEDNEISFPEGAKITNVVSFPLLATGLRWAHFADTTCRNFPTTIGGLAHTAAGVACFPPTTSSSTNRIEEALCFAACGLVGGTAFHLNRLQKYFAKRMDEGLSRSRLFHM